MKYPFVKCYEPCRIYNKYLRGYIVVPCNKCPACARARNSRYAVQCELESKTAAKVVLVTLTYANSFIPRARVCPNKDGIYDLYTIFDGEYLGSYVYDKQKDLEGKLHLFGDIPYLKKEDLQLFVKRLRKLLFKYEKSRIRYFAVGEYGPEHFRPHFHILFFIDSPALLSDSGHKLGEFPRWTWSKRKTAPKTPDAPLSKLEYHIRKCWRFGRIDAQVVSSGSCSSYVAGYVNGVVPLPPVYKIQSTKPFCVHSRFLGREIFRQELADVVRLDAADVVKRCVGSGSQFKTVRLPAPYYSAYYPRCKGFANLSHVDRAYVYRLYETARSVYGDLSLMDLARRVVYDLSDMQFSVTDVFLGSLSPQKRKLLYYFYHSIDPDNVEDILDTEKECVTSVYTELLCSRRFLGNVSELGCSVDWFLCRLEKFYADLDAMNLRDWYLSMSAYMDEDFADEDDLIYFFDNSFFNFGSLKDTFAYRSFVSDTEQYLKEHMKHRLQNDKNRIFE